MANTASGLAFTIASSRLWNPSMSGASFRSGDRVGRPDHRSNVAVSRRRRRAMGGFSVRDDEGGVGDGVGVGAAAFAKSPVPPVMARLKSLGKTPPGAPMDASAMTWPRPWDDDDDVAEI